MTSSRFEQPDTRPDWAALSRRLRGVALVLTRRPDLADELAQQALARALARLDRDDIQFPYLRKTLINLWLDEQRSLRRRIARLSRVAATAAPWHSGSDPCTTAELRTRLQAVITALPARQRAVLTLRLVENMDYTAIAETLDCSVESVRTTLCDARRRLRSRLEEWRHDF
ncbi:MAG: RNA polymerase sigma factor [Phycisphaerales bacterium]